MIFAKALLIVITFLSFKGISHANLLKTSITQKKQKKEKKKRNRKKKIQLLNLQIIKLARSAPQILSIKGDYTLNKNSNYGFV